MKQPEEISYALFSRPGILDLNALDMSTDRILSLMHMGLVVQNYKGEIFAGVAKSWKVSEDKLTYTFDLNMDLTFHDGIKLTCQDVEFTFSQIIIGKQVSHSLSENISTLGCIDNKRFQITLRHPSSFLLSALTYPDSSVLPKKNYYPENAIMGLGPYRLKETNPDSILLERMDDHLALKPWSAKRIRFVFFNDIPEAIRAFDGNQVDIVNLSGFPNTSSKSSSIISVYPVRTWMITFGDEFYEDPRHSIKCINDQINRRAIVSRLNAITPDTFLAAHGLVSPYMPGYIEKQIDTDKQQDCLPNNLAHHIMAIDNLVREELVEEIQKNFLKMGIKIKFDLLAKKEFIQRMFDRRYEMAMFSLNISSSSEKNLDKVYGKQAMLPFIKPLSEDLEKKLIDIQGTHSKSLRANKIYAFEQEQFENPLIVPLFFQRVSYLVRDCLSLENITIASSYEKLQEVGLIPNCH